jgi:hypothetical protein
MLTDTVPLLWCPLGHGLYLFTPPWRVDRCPHCGAALLPVSDAATHELLDAIHAPDESDQARSSVDLPVVC